VTGHVARQELLRPVTRIIPLMRRPNTDSALKLPVTLPRNQLLVRYVVTGPVHRHDTVLRYAVTLQVCTQL
jgi:hypothetical protein